MPNSLFQTPEVRDSNLKTNDKTKPMATKSKGNTGFRNENLFCFNCGQSYNMHLPQPVSMASAMMKQFAQDHANCKPTWQEPVNEVAEKSEVDNANWWATNGAQGTSSKTIFNHLCHSIGVRPLSNGRPDHPYDPDDFSRCYKLLQAVPQWKGRMHEMKSVSEAWSRLVDNWDRLTEMFEENERTEWKDYKRIGMYEFMQPLIGREHA